MCSRAPSLNSPKVSKSDTPSKHHLITIRKTYPDRRGALQLPHSCRLHNLLQLLNIQHECQNLPHLEIALYYSFIYLIRGAYLGPSEEPRGPLSSKVYLAYSICPYKVKNLNTINKLFINMLKT